MFFFFFSNLRPPSFPPPPPTPARTTTSNITTIASQQDYELQVNTALEEFKTKIATAYDQIFAFLGEAAAILPGADDGQRQAKADELRGPPLLLYGGNLTAAEFGETLKELENRAHQAMVAAGKKYKIIWMYLCP